MERRAFTRMADPVAYSGVPRTALEWAALKKVSHGASELSKAELRRLFILGLVERQFGEISLTKHGREMLAFYERTPPHRSDCGVAADEQLPLFGDAEG